MSALYYVKASDVECEFCFLEVSRDKTEPPFMDIRISNNNNLYFCIYNDKKEIKLSLEEWTEIQEKALTFLKIELENENAFKRWSS